MTDVPQLTVRREQRENALVVHVAGEVDVVTAPTLRDRLVGVEQEVRPSVPLVLDLADVSFLASAGLSLLVELNQRCAAAGAALRVAAGNRTVMRRSEERRVGKECRSRW